MLNKVILIGRVFNDPEFRYFKNNNVITIIKLITTEIDKEGKEQSYWHRVIINKKCKGVTKNMIILVEGKIKTRKWIKNNKYNYITEILSEEIKIINDKNYNKETNSENYSIENSKENILENNIEEDIKGLEDLKNFKNENDVEEYFESNKIDYDYRSEEEI